MLDVNYNERIIAKAQALVKEAQVLPMGYRDQYCQERCGLTYDYLRRIGKSFKQPSNRTLMNLGYDLYAKDLATEEFSRLEMNIRCDWNPVSPRMNPISTPVFVTSLSEVSS